jgi:hypothetical protein
VKEPDGTTIAFEWLGDGMPRGQLNILEGQVHVARPEDR